ncbi:MAG: sulfurtransferase complex subunit TusB [Candidatus Hodarchaeota archaeon]
MDILYLFGFSERTGNHLERLLPLLKTQIQKGSEIKFVLIHDGVIGFTINARFPKAIEELLGLDLSVYAMIPDMNARGIPIERLHGNVKPVEYSELVDLLDSSQKVISWI